ncbi:MAG TPA: flagellar biosynthetic protein FliR [Candidatus Gastranaerophilaceae bacterium]|nr:flagellar biosynthetic protein FliR [Candidatus Gastranaerophilaceae bacterium]HPT41028.1 flagellar biosynthetic protein FliR [Candidatus Gastranaerophilaceae bacterium]
MPTDLLVLLSPYNLILFVVVFTRLGGLMSSAPIFSTYPIPMQIKVWFVALITFIIYPIVLVKSGFQAPSTIPELSVILLKEFMIGYVIGFISNLVFVGVEMASEIISIQMGLAAAQALNPLTGMSAPILGQGYVILTSMVFIGLNAHQWLFSAVYKSFAVIPPGYGFIFNGQLTQEIVFLSGQIFSMALGIALPIFAVLFVTDVLLGFTAKMMPQMNIFMVAMPLKIYIGLVMIIMFIAAMYSHIGVIIEKLFNAIAVIF